MFVVVKKSKTSKRELVYIVESYRDEDNKIRQRIIKKCGELSELTAKDPDALDKIKEEAKNMTAELATRMVDLNINLNLPNRKSMDTVNYGYFFVESLYRSLKMRPFLDRHFEDPAEAKQIAEALRFYAIKEFFLPLTGTESIDSIKPIFGFKGNTASLSIDIVAKLLPIADDLMKHLYKVSTKDEDCRDKVASLDVTSYYFNSHATSGARDDRTDDEAMKDLVMVQMGILYDRHRNPMACIVIPEGDNDSVELLASMERLKKKFGLDRIVLTSDRGFGSNSTLAAIHESGNGYVVGRKVKNASLPMQRAILDNNGYKWNDSGTFKWKAFDLERTVGDTAIPEKVIAMWTSFNAARTKQKRDKFIVDFLSNPGNYSVEEFPEMERYVSVHDSDAAPGTPGEHGYFSFDAETYARDMALDGYYALATTEKDIPEGVIIKRYHNLQKMHRAFSEPDPEVEGAPREAWTYDYVRSYFIINFISLVMERKLERMLGFKYTSNQMKTTLSNALCKNIGQDVYDFAPQEDAYRDIEKAFGVRFDKAFATLEMLRRYRREVINAL